MGATTGFDVAQSAGSLTRAGRRAGRKGAGGTSRVLGAARVRLLGEPGRPRFRQRPLPIRIAMTALDPLQTFRASPFGSEIRGRPIASDRSLRFSILGG
jgi:hypothetical protein